MEVAGRVREGGNWKRGGVAIYHKEGKPSDARDCREHGHGHNGLHLTGTVESTAAWREAGPESHRNITLH